MATQLPKPKSLLFIVFLLLSTSLSPSQSISFSQYKTLLSLFHSLMSRVATLRASRGDYSGSARARLIAGQLQRGVSLQTAWSLGWDYLKNYAWRDLDNAELFGVVSDMNELLGFLRHLTRSESDTQRAAWVARNYHNLLRVSKSMFARLLKVFRQPGPMRGMVETMQKEVVDGGLLWDCLELGANDLKGFIQIFKDLVLQFYSANDDGHDL